MTIFLKSDYELKSNAVNSFQFTVVGRIFIFDQAVKRKSW